MTAKRLLDIAASACALLALSPLFLIVMLIERFTGEGKVWYRQTRVGLHGKHFNVLKFVTMLENSERIGNQDITLRDDPRVLPFGRLLRKTKINELPQLLNIFKGDMSLVGWRPLMPKSFTYYPPHIQEWIVRIKPGLTGVGSIVFRDEESYVSSNPKPPEQVYREEIAPYKGELELWYQQRRGFMLDLKILFITAWVVLRAGDSNYRRWLKNLPPSPHTPSDPA